MSKKSITILIFIGVLVGAISIYAWTEPTGSMPETLNGPINTGTTSQTKSGELSATIFRDANDADYYINPSSSSLVSGDIESETSVTSAQFCIGTDCLTSWEEFSSTKTMQLVIRCTGNGSCTPPSCPSGWTNNSITEWALPDGTGGYQAERYCYKEVPYSAAIFTPRCYNVVGGTACTPDDCPLGWTDLGTGSGYSHLIVKPRLDTDPWGFVLRERYCYKDLAPAT